MDIIDTLIKDQKYGECIDFCNSQDLQEMGKLIRHICQLKNIKIKEVEMKTKRVKLLCNWTNSAKLREWWNKMTKGNYRWNDIEIVVDNPDYYVIINCPPKNETFIPEKTVIFQMEPYMASKNRSQWGDWGDPDETKFLKVCKHETDYNNNCWEISRTYTQLKTEKMEKKFDVMSTILSPKYFDPGHIKRVDFVKFLDSKDFQVDVFGSNRWDYKNYKGSLPLYSKDLGLIPYKYTFNCENNSIHNYYTEKLIDGILCECLVFYSGCKNVGDYINPDAFVYLELEDFEKDYQTIKKAIESNLWEERISVIREEKQRILDHLQFFPRLEGILQS